MAVQSNDTERVYGVTDLARRQLADKLRIPLGYFERMRIEKPALMDHTLNTWLADDDERRMIRTLDGKVRAVLSARYRRLDNFELAEHVIPILQRLEGVRFESMELTETRMFLKVVTPRVAFEIAPGDIVQAGIVIMNSEVGLGTLSVQPLVYRLVCSNGLIVADQTLRKTHVGRVLPMDLDDGAVFKDDTLDADDKAFFLKVRDVVEATVAEATFRQIAQKMQKTIGIKITGDPVKAVEVLTNRYSLSDLDRGSILRNLVISGDLTGYGLVNAVTHYSKEVEDYGRATEFEALGGKLIDLAPGQWREIAEAA